MTPAFLQRGIAAGILSALVVIGTGPAAQAQSQRSTQPSTRDSGQAGAGSKACRQACTDGQDQRSQAHRGGSGGCRGWSGGHGSQTGPSRDGSGRRLAPDLLRRLGRLHGPDRPLQDLLRAQPAQGPAAEEPERGIRPISSCRSARRRTCGTRSPSCLASPPRRTARRKPRSATRPMRSSPRTANAWLKNPAEEGQAIATMARGQT